MQIDHSSESGEGARGRRSFGAGARGPAALQTTEARVRTLTTAGATSPFRTVGLGLRTSSIGRAAGEVSAPLGPSCMARSAYIGQARWGAADGQGRGGSLGAKCNSNVTGM